MDVSRIGILLCKNYSFFSVPLAYYIANWPKFYAMDLFNKHSETEYDLANTKSTATADGSSLLPKEAQGRFLRAEAAQNNGFVTLPFYCAAIVAGNLAKLPPGWLNLAAGVYLASRTVYNYAYIHNTTNDQAKLRTRTYGVGIVTCVMLYVAAGVQFLDGY